MMNESRAVLAVFSESLVYRSSIHAIVESKHVQFVLTLGNGYESAIELISFTNLLE